MLLQCKIADDELEALLGFAQRRMGTIGNVWRTRSNIYAFIAFPHTNNFFTRYYYYIPKTSRQPYWKRSG